jgi:hypothetical protein
MIEIINYGSEYKSLWDEFVRRSKNGNFLFQRDYMEYHSDRFLDSSLLFFDENGSLVSLMPANVADDIFYSHGGLTFGGIVSDSKMKIGLMLELFDSLMVYLSQHRIKTLVYKAIPHIYHIIPAEEDLYALFRYGAKLIARDAAPAILLDEPTLFSKARKRGIKQGKKNGLIIKQTNDFEAFMSIQEEVLRNKYNVMPTHTSSEIASLAQLFPQNIKLFAAYEDELMLAGVIIYESKPLVHGQYSASSDIGHKMGASDLLFDSLISQYSRQKKYFDFGISTEKGGAHLNRGLTWYKEGFGARAIAYDTYQVDVARSKSPLQDQGVMH